MRFGLFKAGSSRVVLDAAAPIRVVKAFILHPTSSKGLYRLVVDIAKTSQKALMEAYRQSKNQLSMGAQATKNVNVAAKQPRGGHRKPVIMIDPGHGGVDPGAIGRTGLWEKHIVLIFSKELRYQLQKTGSFRVLMTRNRDIFLRLRERIVIARRAGADLFVSVHADSIRNPKVRGTSVYTLSERASDKEADALARQENMADIIAGVDLKKRSNEVVNILIDLAQRDTMNQSAIFAKILVAELGKVRKMLRNTHRFAGFRVLKAPDIPSVLVELGYLSNRSDEKMLRDPRMRMRMARSVNNAIKKYFARRAFNRP